MRQHKPILRVLAGERIDPPPVWMMRQAGRYLPEYRALRSKVGDFLSLVYTPELAAMVTLQPIHRFQFDAAIIFADILLIPHALGVDLSFDTGSGPHLSIIRSQRDIDQLGDAESVHEKLFSIYESIRLTKSQLPVDTALIGFAGSPWTTATYMIAGRNQSHLAQTFPRRHPRVFNALLQLLTDSTIEYLSGQILAGAEVIKLFDSWAGLLSGSDFDQYVIAPTKRIIKEIRTRHPKIPIIAFARQAEEANLKDYATSVGADCIALDQAVSAEWLGANLPSQTRVQGNLCPSFLCGRNDKLESAVRNVLDDFSDRPHIFNLGHGITPDAKIENVKLMLQTVHDWKKKSA